MNRTLRIWVGLIFAGLSVALLTINNWPPGRVISTVENLDRGFIVPENSTDGQIPSGQDGAVALPAIYSLTLDEPKSWRFGAEDHLSLIVEESGPTSAISPFAGWQVSAEGYLQLLHISYQPAGSIFQRLDQETPADFRWILKRSSDLPAQGTLWLYLLFAPPQGGDPVRVLALARQMSIQSQSLFGIAANQLNLFGWVGLSAGTLIALSGILQKRQRLGIIQNKSDK